MFGQVLDGFWTGFGQVLDGFWTGFRQVLNTNVDHVSQIFPENDHGHDGRK